MRSRMKLFAFLAALVLVIAACGDDDDGAEETTTTAAAAPAETTTTEAMEETTTTAAAAEETTTTAAAAEPAGAICEVTDTGGVDDKSFNQLAWEGAQAVEADLGWQARFLESQAETDYEPNINSHVDAGDCNLIVTVGFLLGDATKTAANANADQQFAIVDFGYGNEVDEDGEPILDENGDPVPEIQNANVQALVFNTHQAAFLAGYVAADQTQTGVIGTYGGINIGGPVTDFMEGYALGAQYYNEQKGTNVTVLGWDPATQDGLFVGNFDSLEDGRAFAENLNDEGADIILPVAGPVGLGSAALAQERGFRIIGVDADWTETAPEFGDIILTSVLKKVDVAVQDAATNVAGASTAPFLVSTLESGGVGIAPLTNALKDNPELAAELEALAAAIIAGDIVTNSAG